MILTQENFKKELKKTLMNYNYKELEEQAKMTLTELLNEVEIKFNNGINDSIFVMSNKIVRLYRKEDKSLNINLYNDLKELDSITKDKEVFSMYLLSKEDKDLLSKYITNVYSDVYCFKNLPEEVNAVILSYVSRSPNSFKENLLKLLKDEEIELNSNIVENDFKKSSEKAAKFNEKWILGYGHSSCAELSQIKFGIDKISILATKELEDNRLGSYIEKSTRYQKFDSNSYFVPTLPEEIQISYCDLMDYVFKVYNSLFSPVKEELRKKYPIQEGQKEKPYENSIHAKACDVLRYLLPTSTYTSLGASFNARSMSYAISKLKSSVYEEASELADMLKIESLKICPTLIKYSDKKQYIVEERLKSNRLFKELKLKEKSKVNSIVENSVKFQSISYQSVLNQLFATILYQESDYTMNELIEHAKTLSNQYKVNSILEFAENREHKNRLYRAFESINFVVDINSDYGAYRDLQRHRMMTQFKQVLTPYNGFSLHPDMYDMPDNILSSVSNLLYYTTSFYETMLKHTEDKYVSQYCLQMAFHVNYSWQLDLRQLAEIIELRHGKEGHISYRKIALSMYDSLIKELPFMKHILKVEIKDSTYLERLDSEMKRDNKNV